MKGGTQKKCDKMLVLFWGPLSKNSYFFYRPEKSFS